MPQPSPFVLNRSGTTLGLIIDLSLADQTLADGTRLVGVERLDFTGGTGADTVVAGVYDDTLSGGGGGDSLAGDAGADSLVDTSGYTLLGGAGDDQIRVSGAGVIDGGSGFDTLQVIANATFLLGSLSGLEEVQINPGVKFDAGAVTSGLRIVTLAGATTGTSIVGTTAADLIIGGAAPNRLDGRQGSDTIQGGPAADTIAAGPGSDVVFGYGGNDNIVIGRGTSPDQIDGGDGTDLLNADYTTQLVSMRLDISNPSIVQVMADGSSVVSIEQLKITGGGGADIFVGGALADTIVSGLGDDILRGNGGNDSLSGNEGYDIAVYGGTRDQYQITLLSAGTYSVAGPGEGADTLTDVETLRFADGDMPLGGYVTGAVYWGSPNGTHSLTSSTPIPDGLGATPGTGFTNTGLTRAPDGTWWLANQGQADDTDSSYTPSLVHLSADFTTKLGEIVLRSPIRSLQGLAYDTATNQLLVASLSEHIVRVVNLNGTLGGTITLGTNVSPNGLAYDPVLDAAIIGRSNGSSSNGTVEWRKLDGTVLKSLTLPTNPDHLFFDPDQGVQGTLYYSYGQSGAGALGFVVQVDVATNTELGRYNLPEADSIEGIYVSLGTLFANNDAYFHRGSPPVNSTLQFATSPAAVVVDFSAGSAPNTIDLNIHDQVLSDGRHLVGVPRLFFQGGSSGDAVRSGGYSDVLVGNAGNDTLSGGGGADRVVGGANDDVLSGDGGDDGIEGGPGNDVVVYSGARADYQVTALGANGALVVDTRGWSPDGTDRVADVETFRFSDGDFSYARVILGGVTSVSLSKSVLAENSSSGAIVGSFSAALDTGTTTFTFSLLDDAHGHFRMSGANLVVAPGAVLDFETAPTQSITVRATAASGSFLDRTFTIGLTNVDEAPTGVHLENTQPLLQFTTVQTRVADLVLDDPDTDPAFRAATYTVSDARFAVIGNGLYLRADQVVDWTATSLQLNVTAREGAFTVVQPLTIPIATASPVASVTLSNSSVIEGAPVGTVVGVLSAEDANGSSNFTFSLLDDDNDRFTLLGNQLVVAPNAALNFETGPTRQVTVHAVAPNGAPRDVTFTINVTDVNETPTDIQLQKVQLPENTTARTKVADLAVADPDTNPAFRAYTFNVSDARFEVLDGGLYLKSGSNLDARTEPVVPLSITVRDGAFTYTKAFSLPVSDAPEAPTNITLTNTAPLVENTTVQTRLADLTVTDPDATNQFTFSVNDARFQILNGSLYLRAGQTIDFETSPSIPVAITVRDGAFSFTKSFTLAVTDVAEGPALAIDRSSVAENSPAGTVVGTLSSAGSPINYTYSLTDNAGGAFVLVGAQVRVATGGALDFETAASRQITVRAVPPTGSAVEQVFSIGVIDVNEAPTNLTLTNTAPLVENTAVQTRLADLLVTDQDTAAAFRNYSFTVNDARFVVTGGSLYLRAGQVIDYEAGSSIPIRITVQDGALSFTKSFSLAVSNATDVLTLNRMGTTLGLSVDASLASQRLADGTVLGPFSQLMFLAGSGADTALGGDRADTLSGGGGADSLSGGGGADWLIGGLRARLAGGEGDDMFRVTGLPSLVDGGAGNDVLTVAANMTFTAGSIVGVELIRVANGVQVDFTALNGVNVASELSSSSINVIGSAGGDTLTGGTGRDTFDGGAGADSLVGGLGADKLRGGSGRDVLLGGDGNDAFEIKRGTGSDDLDGGTGTDTLAADFGLIKTGFVLDISNPAVLQRIADGTTIVNIEQMNITAGLGNDRIVGGALGDVLNGYDGSDTILGGAGADTLIGNDGADMLLGGTGDDLMTGGQGADRFAPGADAWGLDQISDFEDGVDLIDLRGLGLSFSSLSVSQANGNTVVTVTGMGSITLLNELTRFTAADFIFS